MSKLKQKEDQIMELSGSVNIDYSYSFTIKGETLTAEQLNRLMVGFAQHFDKLPTDQALAEYRDLLIELNEAELAEQLDQVSIVWTYQENNNFVEFDNLPDPDSTGQN